MVSPAALHVASSPATCKRLALILNHTWRLVHRSCCTCDGFPPTHKSCRVMICVSDLSHHSGVCLVLCCSVAIPLLVTQDNCMCVCVRSSAPGSGKTLTSLRRGSSRFAVWLTAVVVCCRSGCVMHFTSHPNGGGVPGARSPLSDLTSLVCSKSSSSSSSSPPQRLLRSPRPRTWTATGAGST